MTDTRIPTWTLGERLRKAREDAGLKQADLAPLVFVSRATIAGWENDVHRPPRLAVLRWADLTGVPDWWLIDGGDDMGDALHRDHPLVGQIALFDVVELELAA